jgi:hypothetical protein
MSDTLASIRRALRSARAAERRALKYKMDRYNVLTGRTRGMIPVYDTQKARTTQDVVEETIAAFAQKRGPGRFSGSQHSTTDKLFAEAGIVQPEVRDAWRSKITSQRALTQDERAKLVQQATTCNVRSTPVVAPEPHEARERRLHAIARWMVYMYHEIEGYDPEKHPKLSI